MMNEKDQEKFNNMIDKSLKKKPLKTISINKPERILNMGTEQLKDAVLTVCKFVTAIVDSIADDGKIGLSDFPKFISPVVSLPAAISGIGEVPAELADLTPEEKSELVELVKEELDLGENAEAVIEKALTILYEIKSLVDMLK